MRSIRTMLFGSAICLSFVFGTVVFANAQVVPETKKITKKSYRKGKHVSSTTYRHGKRISVKTWHTGNRFGHRVARKTKHILVGNKKTRP
jgi:hypothetical protein